MNPPPKQFIRLARRIRTELVRKQERPHFSVPAHTLARYQRLCEHLNMAQSKGWRAAFEERRHALLVVHNQLLLELADGQRQLTSQPKPIPSLRDLVMDLTALHEEFDDVELNTKQGTLSVTTEPITLEGQYLGPFSIVLQWRLLHEFRPYYIEAVDPNPPTRDDSVTHPHVQSDVLCEGEGHTAIGAALGSGRLYDFFSLVANVLRNYNPSSPYVPLTEWTGQLCTDCGYSTDDSGCCNRCDATLCDGCGEICNDCGDSYCTECMKVCSVCDDSTCMCCGERCAECDNVVCSGCLADQTNQCKKCHEQEANPTTEPTPVTAAHAVAQVLTRRLG